MNVHTPERQPAESRNDYIARRKRSAAIARRMELRGIGDQHKAPSQRQQLRDSQRANGRGPKGVYGLNLMAYFNRKIFAESAARLQRRAAR